MIESPLIGFALIAVAAFHLVPAFTTGEIPSKWPFKPLTRTTQPTHFKITIAVFTLAGVLGLVIVAAYYSDL